MTKKNGSKLFAGQKPKAEEPPVVRNFTITEIQKFPAWRIAIGYMICFVVMAALTGYILRVEIRRQAANADISQQLTDADATIESYKKDFKLMQTEIKAEDIVLRQLDGERETAIARQNDALAKLDVAEHERDVARDETAVHVKACKPLIDRCEHKYTEALNGISHLQCALNHARGDTAFACEE